MVLGEDDRRHVCAYTTTKRVDGVTRPFYWPVITRIAPLRTPFPWTTVSWCLR